MANELALLDHPAMPSLPRQLAWLASSLGTVEWPGLPTRYTLASRVVPTATEQEEIRRQLQAIEAVTEANRPDAVTCSKARFSVLTKLMLAYPAGIASEPSAAARMEVYQDALADLPPWTVAAAVHLWNLGDAGAANYAFAPPPAVLRKLALEALEPYERIAEKLGRLSRAIPMDRAMDPAPLPWELGHIEHKDAAE